MRRVAGPVMLVVLLAAMGCQGPLQPVFPEVSPAIVWPKPPDQARIRYVGELRGEADLHRRVGGWEAMRAALTGPAPKGAFSRPSAVAVAGSRVFVADTGLAAVHVLDLEARTYAVTTGSPADPLQVPIDVELAEGGRTLVVVDRARAAVDLFEPDGTWRCTRRWPEIAAPAAAAWDETQQTLWLADVTAHACVACRGLTDIGERFGRRGGVPGALNYPSDVAICPEQGLVVVDAMNFRVQVLSMTGRPLAVFGRKGDAAGDFSRPRGVAVDSAGHVYVLDNQFENVQIFTPEGQLLLAFGQGGTGPGEFSVPSGITIDGQDRIWIADSYNRRVQVFQYLAEGA
ncbi:MAG: 6-bladed beta-propeller [Phycisphaerae bacterium]|jgi:DNA-binding beta-propeller fold protein YncE